MPTSVLHMHTHTYVLCPTRPDVVVHTMISTLGRHRQQYPELKVTL